MKEHLYRIAKDWLIPPALTRSLQYIRDKYLSSPTMEEAKILVRNARFQDMYKGRRCFIIANGPSAAEIDLTPLKDEITITMNSFNRNPIMTIWKPTFFCMAGPVHRFNNPPFYTIDNLKKDLENHNAEAYFFRIDVKPLFDQFDFFHRERLYFLKTANPPTPNSTIDLVKTIPGAQDTSIFALMIAIALGCSPIYILGLNYDWLSHRSYYNHFYDSNDPVEIREDLSSYTYLELLQLSIISWRSHEALREIGLRKQQQIFNATEGSFLDVYQKVTFEEALSGNQKF